MSIVEIEDSAAMTPTVRRTTRSIIRASLGFTAHLVQRAAQTVWHEEIVGNIGDLFGLLPRTLQLRELSLERDTLGVLMQRHLERETLYRIEPEQASGPIRV